MPLYPTEIVLARKFFDRSLRVDHFVKANHCSLWSPKLANHYLTPRHEHEVYHGITQDKFHLQTEQNFHQSKALQFFEQWTIDNLDRFLAALQRKPGLSLLEFFAKDTIDWDGFDCSLKYEEGYINIPPTDYVRQRLPTERHRARQINFAIEAIRLAFIQTIILTKVIQAAKVRLEGQEFILCMP